MLPTTIHLTGTIDAVRVIREACTITPEHIKELAAAEQQYSVTPLGLHESKRIVEAIVEMARRDYVPVTHDPARGTLNTIDAALGTQLNHVSTLWSQRMDGLTLGDTVMLSRDVARVAKALGTLGKTLDMLRQRPTV